MKHLATSRPDLHSLSGDAPVDGGARRASAAHPGGLVVGEIQGELGIAGSTLSHHLEKLKNEDLVSVHREGTFLRYSANSETLRDLLAFLYAECCSRSKAVEPDAVTRSCKRR